MNRGSFQSAGRRTSGFHASLAVIVTLMVLALPDPAAHAQTTRERGVGPYTMETTRGEATVRLLRSDRNIVWVDRQVQSGEYIETGVPRGEIIELRAPEPRLFQLAKQAETDEQIDAVINGLRRMIVQLKPFRDLPGIPVNDALILQAKLNEQRDYWRDALVIYEQLMEEDYDFPDRDMIRYWAGINLWRMNKKAEALEYLMDDPVPDDDLAAMSEIFHARADCLLAAERFREAAETYLRLIVFYPFVENNEPRALRGVIPAYVEMQEWNAAIKSLDALKQDYPDAPETAEAETWLNEYAEKLEAERKLQVLTE